MKKIAAFSLGLMFVGAGCAGSESLTNSSVPEMNINIDKSVVSVVPPPSNTNTNTNKPSTNNVKPKTMPTWNPPTVLPEAERTNKEAVIETNKGTIVFEVLADAPLTASNFITLAKGGYYDGIIFHRVVPNFVIQGGDPTGTGAGGPGYKFKDEPVKRAYDPGIVAMANSGPDTNGSQFFIMLPNSQGLPPLYTIFGRVVSGMDVVSSIGVGDVMNKVTIRDIK